MGDDTFSFRGASEVLQVLSSHVAFRDIANIDKAEHVVRDIPVHQLEVEHVLCEQARGHLASLRKLFLEQGAGRLL